MYVAKPQIQSLASYVASAILHGGEPVPLDPQARQAAWVQETRSASAAWFRPETCPGVLSPRPPSRGCALPNPRHSLVGRCMNICSYFEMPHHVQQTRVS